MTDRDVEAVLRAALDALARDRRVRHGEVRFTRDEDETLRVRATRGEEAFDERATHATSRGVGVRVLGSRTWGFASTPRVDEASVLAAVARAVAIADASSAVARDAVPFPPRAPERGFWETEDATDPFAVPTATKLDALRTLVEVLRAERRIVSADAHMNWRREEKHLLTTEGTDVEQRFLFGAAGMVVVAVDDHGRPVRRSHPTWRGGDAFQGGWERFVALDLVGNAEPLRDEALALLAAPFCPAGERDLILEGSQVALQVHESCGHPTELDRAFGTEITLAGGSFLSPDRLGWYRYGAPVVTLTADAVTPGGLGTFGWDDEGTPAGSHVLVDRGTFVDFLSSRETAARLGRASTGTLRASGWNRTPLIRMTNVSLAPGEAGTLEDLVADTKNGILMATDQSWSIDDQRLDFHFACEAAWEIENGRRVRLLRAPLYAGSTPAFWAACDAVCGPSERRTWGIATCGKGTPIQLLGVGHAAQPARFRGVRVGSSDS